ncbi:MAG: hypothetical protein Q9218_006784 [Villophora microphyllina]
MLVVGGEVDREKVLEDFGIGGGVKEDEVREGLNEEMLLDKRHTALEDFKLDPSLTGRKYIPNMHTITTSEELKARIKADVSATLPLEGIAIEATSSYLRSVKTSETSLVQIIEEIIEDDPVRAKAYDLKLTAEASDLLGKDQKAFMDKYGEYFVYGHVARARCTAVCNIKTSSKELCEKIKNSLTAKAGDATGIATSLESYYTSNRDTCTIDTSLEINRLAGAKAETKPHFDVGEVIKA